MLELEQRDGLDTDTSATPALAVNCLPLLRSPENNYFDRIHFFENY